MRYITATGVLLCIAGLITTATNYCYGDVCVIKTDEERAIGITASLLGIAWFMLLNISKDQRILALLVIGGCVGISYLAYYTVMHKHYCPICVATYFVGAIAIIATFKRLNIFENMFNKRRLKWIQQ